METPLGIFSFSGLEKRSLHLRAIEKGPFATSILEFHKTITFHCVLDTGFSPICPRRPGEGWEPSGGGFAPLHRPFGRPAFFVVGPRVTEVSLSGSSRRLNYSVFKVLCWSLVKAYQRFFLSGSDWEYTIWCTLSTPFCESAHYNDNLGSSLTGVTICHSLL